MKFRSVWKSDTGWLRHLPQGRCGLKCADFADSAAFVVSPSVRKVWIEIEKYAEAFKRVESPSVRKVWTKIRCNIFDLKKVFCAKVY